MLAIHYCRQDERTQRHTTLRTAVAIGSDAGNDLVLSDPTVAPRHCRVTEQADAWIVEDLGSAHGIRVNGAPVRAARVRPGDRIYIGAYVVELERIDDRIGPVEERLLDAIERGDDHSRTVYADWLEERGDAVRAEFVRLQQAIIDAPMHTQPEKAAFARRTKRLHELAESIDLAWRMRVAQPAVEGCELAFEIPCKMNWGDLEPTYRPDVRTCHTCHKSVHYCSSEKDALDLARRGQCVVVDIREVYVACRRCGRDNARQYRFCYACGQPLARKLDADTLMVMGAMPMAPPEVFARGRLVVRDTAAQPRCPSCDTPHRSGGAYCQRCGRPLPRS